jgi:hypothetical protein
MWTARNQLGRSVQFAGRRQVVFDHPFYLLLNLAVAEHLTDLFKCPNLYKVWYVSRSKHTPSLRRLALRLRWPALVVAIVDSTPSSHPPMRGGTVRGTVRSL